MYPSTQFIIVLLMLCMCMGCVESQDRMNESILLEKASGDGTKSDVCLNLDKVDEINNRKNKTAQDTTETEEYAVYDRLLGSGNANRSLVVIYENATTGCPHCSAALFYGFNRSSLLEEMPSLDLKAFEDFEAKNNCTYQLKNLFRYSGKYAIVNDSELLEIFLVDQSKNYWDDWEDYYLKKCPHSPGIRYFSRVGFNSNMDQALVQDGINFPYMLAGGGQLVLLEKRNGSWNVTDYKRVWVT